MAEVVGAQGLTGAVKVRPLTDFPDHLRGLETVMLEVEGEQVGVRRVEEATVSGGRAVMKLEGVDDREAARSIFGAVLKIKRSAAAPLPPGHHYLSDIVGLRVVATDGAELGEVTEVIRSPANDVYVTAKAMIPAVKEIVREIDLERGVMIVEPIPGLVEDSGTRED